MRFVAHGLRLESEIPLDSLREATCTKGNPDVVVRRGVVPQRLTEATVRAPELEVGPEGVLVRTKSAGRYLVEGGARITVEPEERTLPLMVEACVTGRCLPAIFFQRGVYPLHASAAVLGGRAFAFAGASGDGKSTLLAGVVSRGARVLTDDFVVAGVGSGKEVTAEAGRPSVRLWRDALESRFEAGQVEAVQLAPEVEKFTVCQREVSHERPAPLAAILFLAPVFTDVVRIEPLSPVLSLAAILQNGISPDLLEALGGRPGQLAHATELAQRVPAFQVLRPRTVNRLELLVERVVEWMEGAAGDEGERCSPSP